MNSFMVREHKRYGTLYIPPFKLTNGGYKINQEVVKNYKQDILEITRKRHSSSNNLGEPTSVDTKQARRPTRGVIDIDML